jgi:4-amino-4-deoxy-L-arabinose transferase-like glycosyltransferase
VTRKPSVPVSPVKPVFPLLLVLLLAGWLGLLVYQTLASHPIYFKSWLPLFQLKRFGPLQFAVAGPHFLAILKNLLLLAAWLAAAFGPGQFLRRRWLDAPGPRLEQVLESLGLGFSLWMLLLFGLGAAGLYHSWLMAGLLIPAAGWGAWAAWQDRAGLRPHQGWLLGRMGWPERGLGAMVLLFGLFTAAMALTPELFFDSLVYHLAVPAAWIQTHGFARLPYNFFSNFPMGLEMLYTGSLLLSDETLCRLLHACLGWLAGLSTFALGRRWFGRRVGLWAMGLFLCIPVVVMNQLVSGVDVAAVFFGVLAVNRFWAWALSPAPSAGTRRELLLAGLLMGASLGVKYNMIFLHAPAVAVGLFVAWKQGRSLAALSRSLVLLGAAASVLVLPWMVKSAVYTANPVFPFLYRWLPSQQVHPEKMQQQMDGFKEYGQRTWVQYLRQPWDLTFYLPTSNSFVGQCFLFLLPGLLLLAWASRRGPPIVWCLLATALAAVLAWSSQTQITRYLIPVFPIVAVLSALVLNQWQARHALLGGLGRLGVLGFWLWSFGVTLGIGLPNWDPFGVLLGLEPRWAYLDRRLMNSYTPMARRVNALPPDSRVLVFGETRAFYFDRPVTAATVYDYNPLLEWISQAGSAEAVWQRLRQEGYTHVFVHGQEAARTRGYEPYRWTDADVRRWQELSARYWRLVSASGSQQLFSVLAEPDASQPVKTGRPLFAYDPGLLGKLLLGYQQGWAILQQGDPDGARARWQQLTVLAPDWGQPYLDLAWLSLQASQQDEAFAFCQQADRLMTLDPGSYNNLGVLYQRAGQVEAAKRCFRQALALAPDLAVARDNLESLERSNR